jgi:hypothetical protein
VSRSWPSFTAPVALAAIALLSLTVASLLRTVRSSVDVRVPIRSKQRVTFDRAGDVILNLEGRTLTPSAGGLRFALLPADAAGASAIPMRRVRFRTGVSSASRARLDLYAFTLPAAGPYTLRISGIDPARDYSADAIVFTRPFRSAFVFHILSLITLGAVFVACLVISGLALTGRPFAPAVQSEQNATAHPMTLEAAIDRSVAVVRARTVIRAGTARYQVLETWAGAVPSQIAGADQPEGLILDPRAAVASGHRPVEGQYVILLLAAPTVMQGVERSSVVLGNPIAILPIADGHVSYAPYLTATRRELTIAELRRLTQR